MAGKPKFPKRLPKEARARLAQGSSHRDKKNDYTRKVKHKQRVNDKHHHSLFLYMIILDFMYIYDIVFASSTNL